MLCLCKEHAIGKIAIFLTNRTIALRTFCALRKSRAQIARRKYPVGDRIIGWIFDLFGRVSLNWNNAEGI
jgi:hypothetical protein